MSFAVALSHIIIIILVGTPAYRYFGAGENLARKAETGSAVPALSPSILVVIFAIWGLYALSWTKVVRRLPLLKTALLLIGAAYALRGIHVFQQIFQIVVASAQIEGREILFSAVSLAIGLAYVVGTIKSWEALGANNRMI